MSENADLVEALFYQRNGVHLSGRMFSRADLLRLAEAAAAAEREACAKIADASARIADEENEPDVLGAARIIARKIRARGKVSIPAARSMPFPDEDSIRKLLIEDDPSPGPWPYGPAVLDDAG